MFRAGRRGKIAVDILEELGVSAAATRLRSYPHQFSGGMRQRVAIATALAKRPGLLIADEPTTALDVTTQLGILRLLARERRDRGLALLFVTHDLSVAQGLCEDIAVMYAGRIVESGPTSSIIREARHPYTRALIGCIPAMSSNGRRLPAIPGSPPHLGRRGEGCAFAPRCPLADDHCRQFDPPTEQTGTSTVACWKAPAAA